MKNIEWLKEEVYEMMPSHSELYDHPDYTTVETVKMLDRFIGLIDQLDEPETLSKKWIENHTASAYTIAHYSEEDVRVIMVSDLQNLLVPKLEEIEAKIQELIEAYKQEDGAYSNPENGWIGGFIEDLENLVEEEQKYRVLDGNTTLLGRINGLMLTRVEILEYYPEYVPTFDLTEQEIKDYDERYWPFAVKVEELGE